MQLSVIKTGLWAALCATVIGVVSAIDTYDVIVVGSGPGGLVAAEFLSRDPSVKVLVLEAGLPSMEANGGWEVPPYVANAGKKFTQFDIPGEYDGARSIFSSQNAKYRVDWLSDESTSYLGKLIGGCSTINAALYFRTPRSYVTSTSWPFSADRVNAGFDAIETMYGHTDKPSMDGQFYLQDAYNIAAKAFREQGGYREVTINDAAARDNKDKSFGHAPFTFKDGLRDSPGKTFYRALTSRPNGKLISSATVNYIKHVNGKATGVVYNGNIEVALSARGAVIMGAGAMGTPKVLMQSGIGPRVQLEKLSRRADFPGAKQSWVINENVGQSLFDTAVVFASFTHPQMKVVQNRQDVYEYQQQFLNARSGPLTTSGPLLIGYENYSVNNRMYEFQTTIIGNGFGQFKSYNNAFFAALYVNNPTSRDYSSFTDDGKFVGFTRRSVVLSTPEDLAAMKSYANKVVGMMQRNGATFVSAAPGQSVDQWVDANRYSKTNHFGGSCYTSGNANDGKRCADEKLRVIGTSNIFIGDGSAMKEGTVNPYGFIMYTGYEAHNMVKEYLAQTPVTPKECSVERDVDYVGNDVGEAPSAKADGCCAICQNRAGCKAYTWTNHNGGTCWLKSGKGATKTTVGAISGVVGESPVTPTCGTIEDNMDYVGNDVGNAYSAKAEGCCDICKGRAGCGAFTWTNYNGGTCWLKSTKGAVVVSNGARSGVIGSTPVTPTPTTPTPTTPTPTTPSPPTPSCPTVEFNTDYIGNDIGNAPSANVDGCCTICKNRAGCKAYTWSNHNGGTCWLKSGKGATAYKAGVHSAVFSGGFSAIEENVDYIGNDIGNVPSTTAVKCYDICGGRAGCGAFTWTNFNGGTCWLKSSKGATKVTPGARSAYIQ